MSGGHFFELYADAVQLLFSRHVPQQRTARYSGRAFLNILSLWSINKYTNVLWIRNCRCSEPMTPLTRTRRGGASGQPGDVAVSGGWTSWPPSWKYDVTAEIRLVNRCVFSYRTILPNFIPIRLETTEPSVFLNSVAKTKTTWVAIWDQFLIQKQL